MTFITFLEDRGEIETENGEIGPFKKGKTVELPKKIAKILLNGDSVVLWAWKCNSCGEISKTMEKPYACPNPNCENTKKGRSFTPIHPVKHHEIGDVLIDNYNFITENKTEELYVYDGGVYENGYSKSVVMEKTKELSPKCKSHLQKETLRHIKTKTYTDREEIDKNPNLLVFENVTLDLKKGELKDHTPEKIITAKIPHKYDPNADCSKMKQFVSSLVDSEKNVKKLQEMIGYSLLRENPLNKAFMGLGPGENGRSTLFRLLTDLLGKENTATVELYDLTVDRFASSELVGKLANICADISGKEIKHPERFKRMTGEDQMRAQRKHRDAFNFKCFATPWFSANDLPKTEEKTRAFFRRWVLITFPFIFTSDKDELEIGPEYKPKKPNILEDIETEEEFSGLINWALEGLNRVLEQEKFTGERSVDSKRELWTKESDPITSFVSDWCITEVEKETPKDTIYHAFCDYCRKKDFNPVIKGQLTKGLKKDYRVKTTHPRMNGKKTHCYQGIQLRKSIRKKLDQQKIEGFK